MVKLMQALELHAKQFHSWISIRIILMLVIQTRFLNHFDRRHSVDSENLPGQQIQFQIDSLSCQLTFVNHQSHESNYSDISNQSSNRKRFASLADSTPRRRLTISQPIRTAIKLALPDDSCCNSQKPINYENAVCLVQLKSIAKLFYSINASRSHH